jgi:hypothetical protein
MPTVVVIDLQPHFTKNLKLLNNAAKELKTAMQQQYPILLLEYFGRGETHQFLLETIKDYKKVYITTKRREDGSKEIRWICNKFFLPTDHFIVFGVYSDGCVLSTVIGMTNWYIDSKIDIITNACDKTNWREWKSLIGSNNINLKGFNNEFARLCFKTSHSTCFQGASI